MLLPFPIRFMAYKDPKRRQMWLRMWIKEIERAEEEFPVLFNIDEMEEFQGSYKIVSYDF